MRGEYDLIEDFSVKHDNVKQKSLMKKVIGFTVFILFCIVFFSSAYLLSLDIIEKNDATIVRDDKSNSHKTFYIEQKLLKDLEKMSKTKK